MPKAKERGTVPPCPLCRDGADCRAALVAPTGLFPGGGAPGIKEDGPLFKWTSKPLEGCSMGSLPEHLQSWWSKQCPGTPRKPSLPGHWQRELGCGLSPLVWWVISRNQAQRDERPRQGVGHVREMDSSALIDFKKSIPIYFISRPQDWNHCGIAVILQEGFLNSQALAYAL